MRITKVNRMIARPMLLIPIRDISQNRPAMTHPSATATGPIRNLLL